MVGSTEPLVRLLGQRLGRGGLDNVVMLEVLTRRYYGNRGLVNVRATDSAGGPFVVAERAGSRLASTAVSFEALGEAPARAGRPSPARRRTTSTRYLPGVGEAAGGLRRDGPPPCTRSSAPTRCRGRCAGSPPRSPAAMAR